MPEHGIVKWYSLAKGYGFIRRHGDAEGEDGEQGDVFVHYSEIPAEGLAEGDHVSFELVESPLPCPLILDVGHNPDAAAVLAECLAQWRPAGGRVVVLLGMLEDKQPDEFVRALAGEVDDWWLLTLDCPRGLAAERLRERIGSQVVAERLFGHADDALRHALSSLSNQDIMLATGSFVTVELVQRALSAFGEQANHGS